MKAEDCRHKFVDSTRCIHCGEPFNTINAQLQAAIRRLKGEADAVRNDRRDDHLRAAPRRAQA